MFRLKKYVVVLLVVILGVVSLVGCSSQKQADKQTDTKKISEKVSASKEEKQTLLVYCGAALRKPMDEIGKTFYEKYGVEIKYTYGACAQNLNQI